MSFRVRVVHAICVCVGATIALSLPCFAKTAGAASEPASSGEAASLRKSADDDVEDMLKTMKDAPPEQKYYLAQKIFWLRGNFELCSFTVPPNAPISAATAKCLRRLQPEGTPPFRDLQIGEFRDACKGVPAGRRKKDCVASAKKAQQNFDHFAKEAEPLLPNDGAVAGAGASASTKLAAKSPQQNAAEQDLSSLCEKMLQESERFAGRVASAVGGASKATTPAVSTGEK